MPEAVPAPASPEPAAVPRRFELPPEAAAPAVAPAADGEPVQNTGDQAPPAVSDGDKPKEPTPDQAVKRETRRFERRIDKAYRERAEANARADQLEKRLAALEKPAVAAQEGAPTLAQFDYDPEKYGAAREDFARKQAEKDFQARQQSESSKQHHQRITAAWEEKVDRAEGKYDDFSTVVGDLQPSTPFFAAIMEAENGEDIAYHLGKNPKEAARIAQLPPVSQIREIGKLEAKLLSEPAKPRTPSRAPAPITPVSGTTGTVEKSIDDPNLPYEEFLKLRNKQLGRRR